MAIIASVNSKVLNILLIFVLVQCKCDDRPCVTLFLCACEDKLFVGLSHFLTIKNIKKRAQNSIIKDNLH